MKITLNFNNFVNNWIDYARLYTLIILILSPSIAYAQKLLTTTDKEGLATLLDKKIQDIDPIEKAHNDLSRSQAVHRESNNIEMTILIQCQNSNYLADCLSSIFAQQADFSYEIVCINTNCNQNITDLIKNFKLKHKVPIIILEKQVNPQASIGLRHIQGDLILCLTDTDVLAPTLLQRLINKYRREKNDFIFLSHTIALYPGELTKCPISSKYYTAFEQHIKSFSYKELFKNDNTCFFWGFKNTIKAISSKCYCEMGGISGLKENGYLELAISCLLKGYRWDVLSNGFSYKYHYGQDWFTDIFNPNLAEQIFTIIDSNFPELLDRNGKYLRPDCINYIVSAYTHEMLSQHNKTYHDYLSAIELGSIHPKIFLKAFRAFLKSDYTICNKSITDQLISL